jgi:hypothetical protein
MDALLPRWIGHFVLQQAEVCLQQPCPVAQQGFVRDWQQE